MRHKVLFAVVAYIVVYALSHAAAQTIDFLGSEAAIGPIVRGAPYSAESVTTLTQTLGDGTRIERTVEAKVYRDSVGRLRRDQTIVGLAALNPLSDSQALVTIVDPPAGVTYVMDQRARTVRRMPIDRRALAGSPPAPPPPPARPSGGVRDSGAPPLPPPPPPRPDEESLGTRHMEGLTVTGRRSRTTIPAGHIGNDRPIEVIDERWESSDLRVLVWSRHHDPRTGDVEYRLTNIRRAEPPASLFAVPDDYTIVDAPPPPPLPPPPPPGSR